MGVEDEQGGEAGGAGDWVAAAALLAVSRVGCLRVAYAPVLKPCWCVWGMCLRAAALHLYLSALSY